MGAPTLHLRSECKPLEHRSALTPSTCKALLDAGFTINVEKSPERIFSDEEFSNIGASLVPEGSWPQAPQNTLIIGLKELPEESYPLIHEHILFGHCFKGQKNAASILSRFPAGGGTLLDLEFLTDDSGRRVAAFGYHAGYAGAALAILDWAWQLKHPSSSQFLPSVSSYPNEESLVKDVRRAYDRGIQKSGQIPQVLIIGALGRCGRGAVDLCLAAGIPTEKVLKWDLAETASRSGPYTEIVESDIFVHCIYLSKPIPPFVDMQSLANPNRKLRVVCDVSCDTTNPHNPIAIYDDNTTFDRPTVPVKVEREPPLNVISIDHLPSLLPREASEAFSAALLPSLLSLKDRKNARVWTQAEDLFREKVAMLPNGA